LVWFSANKHRAGDENGVDDMSAHTPALTADASRDDALTKRLGLTATVGMLLTFAFLYRNVIVKLVSDWAHDDNYSHGFLIVPLAAYFAWERRERLKAAALRPSVIGLIVILGSLATLIAGVLGAELFLTRVSIVGTVAGIVLYLLGWQHLRILALPIGFLLLMIPIPAIIFNQIAFPLQLLASQFGETVLNACRIPVLREGNVMILANITLEVAEACSGIRSLISLLTLGIVYGYFTDPRIGMRTLIAVATIPIAIVTNGARVAGTGMAAHYSGVEAAQGFFHTFSGWLVFLVAFGLLFVVTRLLIRAVPRHRATEPMPAVTAPPIERPV
jgi:exosortase